MMSEEERLAFYQEIPPWLRHCPFAYVLQQNGSEQQRIMMQQRQQQNVQTRTGTMPGGGGGGGVLPGGMTPQVFAAQQQQLMNDPAKRAKMNAFSARLPGFKQTLEPEIAKMDVTAKKAYLASFADHPALVAVNAAGSDPFLRLERLMDLSDQDLHAVLKMQAIVASTIQVDTLPSSLPSCQYDTLFLYHSLSYLRCKPLLLIPFRWIPCLSFVCTDIYPHHLLTYLHTHTYTYIHTHSHSPHRLAVHWSPSYHPYPPAQHPQRQGQGPGVVVRVVAVVLVEMVAPVVPQEEVCRRCIGFSVVV